MTAPPQPIVSTDLWHLYVGPATIERAAAGWAAVGAAATKMAETVNAHADTLRPPIWTGETSEVYHRHRLPLTEDTAEAGEIATRVAGALTHIASALRDAQADLLDVWRRVETHMPVIVVGLNAYFYPGDPAEAQLVHQAISAAQAIRARLENTLSDLLGAIERLARPLDDLLVVWWRVADERVGWPVPGDPGGTRVIEVDGRVVVNTGPGDQLVSVHVDPSTGETVVTIDAEDGTSVTRRYPLGTPVTIRAGGGNDNIFAPADARVSLTILGGQGDDRIFATGNNRIFGLGGKDEITSGAGNDFISGGADDDYIDAGDGDDAVFGRNGNDVIYGMAGNDRIFGGDGDDYLEGATGDDVVSGGTHNDVVSGGQGDDLLLGGWDQDRLIGGQGADTLHGGHGEDYGFLEPTGDRTGGIEQEVRVLYRPGLGDSFVRVIGSDSFVARIAADMEVYRSISEGQHVLEHFDQHNADTEGWITDGETVTIREGTKDEAGTTTTGWLFRRTEHHISSDPEGRANDGSPPIVGLWHELAGHVRDYTTGTLDRTVYSGDDVVDHERTVHGVHVMTTNAERNAVGLPIDHDGDPTTPEQPDPVRPTVFTENALRRLLGLPERLHYVDEAELAPTTPPPPKY